jgi:molybdenum cofactor cytidylyltransferase
MIRVPRLYSRVMDRSAMGAVILAAGTGSRFRAVDPSAGSKLLAPIDGRPVLQHVLDAVAAFAPAVTIVVVGGDGPTLHERLDWRNEHLVANPAPELGLSSSIQVGLREMGRIGPLAEAAFLVLGDQPDVRVSTFEALLAAADPGDPHRPFVVPRYARSEALNPVLIRRSVWSLAEELRGDRGFGPHIHAHPELVRWVPIEGAIDDIDTPADLAGRR